VLVVMAVGATEEQAQEVRRHIIADGLTPHESRGQERIVIGVVGDVGLRKEQIMSHLAMLPGVESVTPISKPFKLTSRDFHPADTVIAVGGTTIGGGSLTVMAGPCAVEGRDQLLRTADAVAAAGATILRGGAFKPRTSPYTFQGLGMDGLRFLVEARERTGLPIVTEVMEPGQVEAVAAHADILQVGARNMQNYPLLLAAGHTEHPVMLKRGLSATIEEWLMAAEYIVSAGNPRVILCERGIRTFETATRNTLDLTAVPLLHRLTHLPVIVDPSHATGKRWLVPPMALAAVAAGADGIMVEVHPDPDDALSDGEQSLTLEQFADLAPLLRQIRGEVEGMTAREGQGREGQGR
jgi:3-deoxy-7-phosphoheptulonate synthase